MAYFHMVPPIFPRRFLVLLRGISALILVRGNFQTFFSVPNFGENLITSIMKKILVIALALGSILTSCKESTTETSSASGTQVQPAAESASTPAADVSAALDISAVSNSLREDFDGYKAAHLGKPLMVKGIVSSAIMDSEEISMALDPIEKGDKWDNVNIKFAAGTDLSEVIKLFEDDQQTWKITAWVEGDFTDPMKLNDTGRPFYLENAKLLKIDKVVEE